MGDILPAYVRGSTFIPSSPSHPGFTLSWFQAWDPSGKGTFIFPNLG